MISFANGIPTAEERRQIEQSLTDKFTSEKVDLPNVTPIME